MHEEPLCELSNELKGRFEFWKVSLDPYVMPFCETHTAVQNAGLHLALYSTNTCTRGLDLLLDHPEGIERQDE